MSTKKPPPNGRDLEDIAAAIHKLERANIFDMGDLLIEAKAKCEHGGWLDWLEAEFDWSPDTAENYMGAATLALKYRSVRFLRAPVSVIYALADVDDDLVPDAIAALEGAASKGHVTAKQGQKLIELACLRREHGDLPDETLAAIERTDYGPNAEKFAAALKEAKPVTEAEADAIIESVRQQCDKAVADDDDDDDDAEVKAIRRTPTRAAAGAAHNRTAESWHR